MDGEDLSKYDEVGDRTMNKEEEEDEREALDQLEWELASQDGRIVGKWQEGAVLLIIFDIFIVQEMYGIICCLGLKDFRKVQ